MRMHVHRGEYWHQVPFHQHIYHSAFPNNFLSFVVDQEGQENNQLCLGFERNPDPYEHLFELTVDE